MGAMKYGSAWQTCVNEKKLSLPVIESPEEFAFVQGIAASEDFWLALTSDSTR